MKRKAASPGPDRRLGAATTRPPGDGVTNEGARAMRRRAWPRTVLGAAVIIATATLALLAAGCSAGPSSGGAPDEGGSPRAVDYSQCMRSHGVPDYPDPTSSGGVPKVSAQHLGVSGSQYQTASQACRHLLPNGGSGMTQAQVQQMRVLALRYARCMRAHGVANFPDPAGDGHYPDALEHRAENSPRFPAASRTCDRLVPGPSVSSSQAGGS